MHDKTGATANLWFQDTEISLMMKETVTMWSTRRREVSYIFN